MKYVTEFRDPDHARAILARIARTVSRPWVLMEICGGQTHAILRHGLDQLLPPTLELVHGPGCPVCVTSLDLVDKAHALARRPEVILASYGDMLRVPGSRGDLFGARAEGGDVRLIYSPLDAVRLARDHPLRQVVLFGIGFETTAPATAAAVLQAHGLRLRNFAVLAAHVRVPPAMRAILQSDDNRVQGFLAAGHVCAVMGYHEYLPIAAEHRVPIVVTGFEPVDILQGVLTAVEQLEWGRVAVENAYARAVTREGNVAAQRAIDRVFEPCDRTWRGIGAIPASGLRLRPEFADHDAELRFDLSDTAGEEPGLCLAGLVLRGVRRPPDCPAFGLQCTPEHPLGAPMVSSEGACAAYWRFAPDHGRSTGSAS